MPTLLLANKRVVLCKNVSPRTIAKLDQPLGRVNDIREQYAREYAISISVDIPTLACQERLDFAYDGIHISNPWRVVHTGEFHILRSFDVAAKVPTIANDGSRLALNFARRHGNAGVPTKLIRTGGVQRNAGPRRSVIRIRGD